MKDMGINILGLLGTLAALILFILFIYDRFFRIKHNIHVDHRNITFSTLVSKNADRNNKLVLLVGGLKIINTSKEPYTLKSFVLRYKVRGADKESHPYQIPVGNIEDWHAIGFTNGTDTIIMRWDNIQTKIISQLVLHPGEVLSGSVMFILDASKESMRDFKNFSILIHDFLGNITEHKNIVKDSWYKSIDKGMVIIDAPVTKIGEAISWVGIELGLQPKA